MSEEDVLNANPKLKETLSRLRRLVELSVTLNSTLNLKDLLSLIISTAADILGCDAASILLYDERKDALFFAAATGEDAGKLAKIPVPLDKSLAGAIFRTGEALVINELEDEPLHNKQASAFVGFNSRSLLGVPLEIKDRRIGVLEALNKRDGNFSESDIITLGVIASHAAVAINNAQLVQALKDAYEEVSKADQMKSTFLSLASHELRTPLGIIIGYATFLEEDADDEVAAHVAQVLNAALKMRTILEDMNSLTLLDKGSAEAPLQKIALQDVLREATNELSERAKVKEQKISFKFPENPVFVKADGEKLRAAVEKVLHNAIRFSPVKTEILLGVEKKNNAALCWICDEGIGIPKEELEKIFERFYQVEDHHVRHYGGLGIGLTIAEGLIKAQGGRIWAESKGKGQGATFKILLPMT